MPAIDRGLDGFLSDGLRDALRRRLRELAGVALVLLSVLLALALATWSVQDPSLSHATNTPIRNVLGLPGAIVADLLMQLFGVAALALVLPIAVWGWRLASHRPLSRERIRLIFWVVGVLLAAAFASCLPRSATWPLPAGLGGVIGDGLLRLPILLGAGSSGVIKMAIAATTGIGALVAFAIASGIGWQGRIEDRDADETVEPREERASISLGWITHGFLSLKARLARLFTRAPARAATRREALAVSRRAEPRFEESGRAPLQPALEPDLDDEEEDDDKPRAAPRPPRRSSGGYVLPALELLATPKSIGRAILSAEMLRDNATALEGVLGDFGVRGEIINARPGPVVTLYELEPAPGIKSS